MAFKDVEAGRDYRNIARGVIQKAKSIPCMDCNNTYPYYVMDFDHRPEELKLFNINKMPGRVGLAKVLLEIAKCDVVCSNCHRERTFNRNN